MNSALRTATPSNTGFSLCAVSQSGTHIAKPACRLGRLACRPPAGQAGLGGPVLLKPITHLLEAPRGTIRRGGHPVDIDGTNSQCFLSLTDFPRAHAQKAPNVFYHLQPATHLTTSVFYHFQKRRGGSGGTVCVSRRFQSGRYGLCSAGVPAGDFRFETCHRGGWRYKSAKSFIPSTYGVRSYKSFRISTYRKNAGG